MDNFRLDKCKGTHPLAVGKCQDIVEQWTAAEWEKAKIFLADPSAALPRAPCLFLRRRKPHLTRRLLYFRNELGAAKNVFKTSFRCVYHRRRIPNDAGKDSPDHSCLTHMERVYCIVTLVYKFKLLRF